MRLAGAAVLALILMAVLPVPASAGTTACLGGRPATYCAIAQSVIDVDCAVADGNYTCTIQADWRAGGATRGPGPGESVGPVWLSWGLCDGYGCEEFFGDVGVPCA